MNIASDLMIYSAPVAKAMETGAPVVALESTIITHGMPHPQNIETARAVEQAIRDRGAVPATIAVMDGKLHIGLDDEQLDALAKHDNVMKLSRADFAYAFSEGQTGSTTVAATMIAARLAGIDVFATGGIGGVHKGAETSFDISADLQELGQTNIMSWFAPGQRLFLTLIKHLKFWKQTAFLSSALVQMNCPHFGHERAGWQHRYGSTLQKRLPTTQRCARSLNFRAVH